MGRPEASSDVFRAVADPTRRALIDLLAESDRTAGALAGEFESCQSTISEHLAVLRRAELVTYTELGGRRVYRLTAEPLSEVLDWTQKYAP